MVLYLKKLVLAMCFLIILVISEGLGFIFVYLTNICARLAYCNYNILSYPD